PVAATVLPSDQELQAGDAEGHGYAELAVSPTFDPTRAFEDARVGSAELPAHLRNAVDQAAHLLRAAGAMLYLVDDTGKTLRWAYDAGIRDADELAWVRSLQFPVGVGMFGRAVSDAAPQSTSNYGSDPRFVHSPLLDRFVREFDVASMVVAPLIGDDGPIGALGAFARTADAFDEASVNLLTALAGHAALAVTNARLIDELAVSREALGIRATSERSLRQIAARITASRDPAAISRDVVDESHRLLHSDFALLCLLNEDEILSMVFAGDVAPKVLEVTQQQKLHIRGSLLEKAVSARTA